MARVLILFIACCFALGACTQRSICPAFQSAYIYDKEALRKKFSYFLDDSTPKVFTASKTKYLIAEPTSYRKKIQSLQTIAMKPVPVVVPDSLLEKKDQDVSLADLDRAARSVIDSTVAVDVPARQPVAPIEDSVYVITKDRELRLLKYNGADSLVFDPDKDKYVAQKPEYYVKNVGLNIEQDNYMWYLRDYLVLPDVRLAKIQQSAEGKAKEVAAKREKRERKGLKGFFKNLFKKKEKTPDSIATPPPPKEEFDFINVDTLSQAPPPSNQQAPKKGFFGPGQQAPVGQGTSDPALTPASDPRDKQKGGAGDAQKKQDDGF